MTRDGSRSAPGEGPELNEGRSHGATIPPSAGLGHASRQKSRPGACSPWTPKLPRPSVEIGAERKLSGC